MQFVKSAGKERMPSSEGSRAGQTRLGWERRGARRNSVGRRHLSQECVGSKEGAEPEPEGRAELGTARGEGGAAGGEVLPQQELNSRGGSSVGGTGRNPF